jgi:transcriptional regulator with XRE-family HTH domain
MGKFKRWRHSSPFGTQSTGNTVHSDAAAEAVRTIGEFVARRRKKLALTQKEVAAGIVRDDGKPLSVQYLNDIEHGRRGAPADYVIGQLAKLCGWRSTRSIVARGGCLSTFESDWFQTDKRPPPTARFAGNCVRRQNLKNLFPTM